MTDNLEVIPTDPNVWHPLGDLRIDTGMIALCDPAHASAVAESLDLEKIGAGEDFVALVGEGQQTLAIACVTGLGEGNYRVVARHEDVPGFGRRIAELRIMFLP